MGITAVVHGSCKKLFTFKIFFNKTLCFNLKDIAFFKLLSNYFLESFKLTAAQSFLRTCIYYT